MVEYKGPHKLRCKERATNYGGFFFPVNKMESHEWLNVKRFFVEHVYQVIQSALFIP